MRNSYKIMPVDNPNGKFGVFESDSNFPCAVFQTKKEAKSYIKSINALYCLKVLVEKMQAIALEDKT